MKRIIRTRHLTIAEVLRNDRIRAKILKEFPPMKTAYEIFNAHVQESKLDPKLERAPIVAMIAGPSVVIEAIVRRAEAESGIKMDWGYIGGRGMVHADGDIEKAREALRYQMPVSDLK